MLGVGDSKQERKLEMTLKRELDMRHDL